MQPFCLPTDKLTSGNRGRRFLLLLSAILMACCWNAPSALAGNGTWIGGGGNTNYSNTANWSGGTVASGTAATATINASGSIYIDASQTIGTWSAAWNNGTSLNLTGSSAASLSFAVSSGTPLFSTATYYSRNDYIGTLNLSGTQGISFKTASNDLVLQAGLGWVGFSGTVTLINNNNDGGVLYAQAGNVLPALDLVMTPGNETNGYGNSKLILGGSTSQTIGALISANTTDNTAYISMYDGSASLGSAGTPLGTNVTGPAVLTIGADNHSGTYAGVIGKGYNNSGNAVYTSANAANLSILKAGTGTEILSGSLFYTGTTAVAAGSLLINGTQTGGGAYTVSSGGTLGGTGTITPVDTTGTLVMISVQSGGVLRPGSGGTGALTLSGTASLSPILAFASGATATFDLSAGLGNGKAIIVGGTAATDVTFDNTVLNFNDLTSGNLGAGQYILFQGDSNTGYGGLTVSGSGYITGGLTIGSGLSAYPSSTLQLVGNNIVLNVVLPPPGAPTGLAVTGTAGGVGLAWSPSSGASAYAVQRSTSNGTGFATIATVSGTTYTDRSFVTGTTYYYVVSASNLYGTSGNSNQVSATPVSTSGTWTGGTGTYSGTTNWSNGIVASGVGTTMTIAAAGTINVDTNVTLGNIAATWNNGTSLVLSGAAGGSLNFSNISGTPVLSTATYYSRNDYLSGINLSGTQGLSINTSSNVLVLQTGVTWSGFSGGLLLFNYNNDGGAIYAQGNNVLPPTDLTLTPGNETNGYGNTKVILNGLTAESIGALNSTTTADNTAYISSYAAGDIGSGGTPSGTNTVGLATLTIGVTNDSGVYAGNIGEGFVSGGSVDASATAANLAIVKNGSGTQVFAGFLDYTGTTTVNAGTLLITGTDSALAISGTATGAYVVNSGGALGGTGVIRPASSAGSNPMLVISGTLAPGNPSQNGGVGTLTLDGANSSEPLLQFASGGVLSYVLGAGGTGSAVDIANSQAGDVIFNNNTINFNDPTSGSLTSGTYVLFQGNSGGVYTGLTTNGSNVITAGLSIGSGLSNYPGSTLAVAGNNIVLILAPSIVAGTPSGVTVSSSGTQVTVSWTASANAISYTIYRSTTPDGTYSSIGTSGTTSYVDTTSSNGTTYYYEVTASNGSVQSPASGAVSVTPLNINTISVVGVHLRAYNTYGMAVSDTAGVVHVPYWNNFLGPVVQGETTAISSLTNQFGVVVPGLSASWTAGNTGGSYNSSGTIETGSDAVTVPPATNDVNLYASVFDQWTTTPSTLSIAGIPYSSFDLIVYVYDGGSSRGGSVTVGATTYYIRGGAGMPVTSGSGYVQSDDTTLGAGTNVEEGNYVRFSGLSGSSVSATFVAQAMGDSTERLKVSGFQIVSHDAVSLPIQAPAAPAGLSAISSNQEIGLNWSASPTATWYNIYRGTSPGSYTLLTGGSVTAPITSYADVAVTNGTTYYYAVSAVNSVGEGAQSTGTVSATPAMPSFTLPQRTVYQWSLPMAPFYTGTAGTYWPYDSQRRAYLWIPPACTKVQGVVVGLHNMLEKPLFDDPSIRQACTNANLAILFIAPGDAGVWTPNGVGNYTSVVPASTAITLDPDNYESQDIVSGSTHYTTDINPATGTRFANQSEEAGAELAQLLTKFATLSGYPELQYAPVLLTDHSAGSTFCWVRTVPSSAALTGRVFAILPNKGTYPGNISNLLGIPIFHVSSEWQEISDWGNTWEVGDAPSLRALRGGGTNCLIGECVQPGTGHYEYAPEQATPLADFIQAAAAERIPANWQPPGYPTLNSIDPTTGWVVDVRTMGSGTCQAVSYNSWVAAGNDPLRAYWYPDETTAQDVCNTANAGFSKKPQMISAFSNLTGTAPAPLGSLNSAGTIGVGYVPYSPTLESDGVTFQVRAASVNQSPIARLNNGNAMGIATGPILFRANGSGSLKQTGANTFQVWLDRESVTKGGQPWEPFILCYQPGDSQYRSAYRPIQVLTSVPVNLISGSTQTITFPTLPNVTGTNLQQITLSGSLAATASSGLPVQYWVASGPYRNDENNSNVLIPDTVPANASFPMPVIIGAWQWGRPSSVGSAVQSATPVFQTFWINQTALNNWRHAYFGTYNNSGSAADTASPAGDGISNLIKYATGLSPLAASGTPPAVMGSTSSGSMNYLTVTFNQIADPALTYTVEATSDPAGTWSSIWSSTGAANVAGSVTVQDTAPIGQQSQRFLRLRVSY